MYCISSQDNTSRVDAPVCNKHQSVINTLFGFNNRKNLYSICNICNIAYAIVLQFSTEAESWVYAGRGGAGSLLQMLTLDLCTNVYRKTLASGHKTRRATYIVKSRVKYTVQ